MAALLASILTASTAKADFSFTAPLATGPGNKLDLGSFAAGTTLKFTVTGTGDLLDTSAVFRPDGSLAATSSYAFANPGAAYSNDFGGDGINHFVGGGYNYFPNYGFGFAGKMTTDTTDPAAIRYGALVGTFSANPTRSDWFLVGTSATIIVPTGGAHLYLAVNDAPGNSGDNHGAYTGSVVVTPAATTPEPASIAMLAIGGMGIVALARKRRS